MAFERSGLSRCDWSLDLCESSASAKQAGVTGDDAETSVLSSSGQTLLFLKSV